jgi:hypothetical protein
MEVSATNRVTVAYALAPCTISDGAPARNVSGQDPAARSSAHQPALSSVFPAVICLRESQKVERQGEANVAFHLRGSNGAF